MDRVTAKHEFLTRISNRLGREHIAQPPQRSVQGSPDFWKEFNLRGGEKISQFKSEVEQLGGEVSMHDSLDELHDGLKQLLHQLNPPSLLTWGKKALMDWNLDAVMTEWNVLKWDETSFLEQAEQCTVGITSVDYAIANTGTLVVCTDVDKARSASLLPMVHVALVRAEQIKTRMGEVLEEFKDFTGIQAPSSIHFISGPSRSADIENDLSIGVHGPAALYVMILRG
jgi:L-lactate dehydrogenase complex protein LldG